jgi:hypothetical protein
MAVNPDGPVAAPMGGRDDVEPWLLRRPQLPEVGSRAMAQDGTAAREQNRRDVAAFPTETAMTDGIDAAVDWQQPLRRDALPDLMPREADPEQLAAIDDAVLSRRQRRDRRIKHARSTFDRETRLNVKLAGHPREHRCRGVTGLRAV